MYPNLDLLEPIFYRVLGSFPRHLSFNILLLNFVPSRIGLPCFWVLSESRALTCSFSLGFCAILSHPERKSLRVIALDKEIKSAKTNTC